MVDARSDTATRRCECPKSILTAAPAEASNDSRMGGRPPCAPCASPGSGRSTTSPSACRSATRLDTVDRDSPVRRAMSAREICPSSRNARITRKRFRRRSDSSDPARPGGMGQRLERMPPGLSTLRTNWAAIWRESAVRVDRHHDAPGELVVPALLLLVPDHPEVAQEEGDRRQDHGDLADERPAVADRAADAEVVDADAERHLAEGLARVAALHVGE